MAPTDFFSGGHISVPGSAGSFDVTGLPFKPAGVLFLWTNAPLEGVWTQAEHTNPVGGGIGWAGVTNLGSDDTILQASIHEIWELGLVGSELSDACVAMRGVRAGTGYDFKLSLTGFLDDGFTLDVIHAPAGARHLYYLAFGSLASLATFLFQPDASNQNIPLGFTPDGFLVFGSGGTPDFPRVYETSTWLEWGLGGTRPAFSAMGLGRGLFATFVGDLDPQQWNIQHDLGGDYTLYQLLEFHVEPFVLGANIASWLQIRRGADTVSLDFYQGLDQGYNLGMAFTGCQVSGGSHETGIVGDWETIDTGVPALPACVFLVGPLYDDRTIAQAGQSFGFKTADFECVVAWGGDEGGSPGAGSGGASRFMGQDLSWVAGFEHFNAVAPITAGQTDLGDTLGEFFVKPTVSDNATKRIWWEAFFPLLPTVVSASANTYAHKRIGITSLRS